MRPFGTVEFRQHESTLDPLATTAWIDLTTSIVKHCHDAAGQQIVQLCAQGSQDLKFMDLLRTIKCRPSTVAYYRQHTNPASFNAKYRQQLTAKRFSAMQNMGLWRTNVMGYLSCAEPKKVAAAIEMKRKNGRYGAPVKASAAAKKQVEALWKSTQQPNEVDESAAKLIVFRALDSTHRSHYGK